MSFKEAFKKIMEFSIICGGGSAGQIPLLKKMKGNVILARVKYLGSDPGCL